MKLLLILLSITVFNSVLAQQSERKPISQRIQKKAPSVVKEKEVTYSYVEQQQGTTEGLTYSVDQFGNEHVHDKAYYEARLAELNDFVQGVQTKIDYVKNNPEEDAIAKSNGWYLDMENVLNTSKEQKLEYLKKIESFK